MPKQTILIIDTGCANISSVNFAISRLGYRAAISANADMILNADKLFLPGVGTAKEAMRNLHQRELVELIARLQQPVLGICLGMQLLGSISSENQSTTSCLHILDSPITLLQTHDKPLPHMGWNKVQSQPNHPLFHNIPNHSYFYFVHSYGMALNPYTIADCSYGSVFSAAVQKGNFYGVQFHPERSSKYGARLIQNFIEM